MPFGKITFVASAILLLNCHFTKSYGQQYSALPGIYNAFDSVAGTENLGINNGLIHINSDLSDNKTHRYLENKFETGNVVYDGQTYYNANLKYDIFQDILIAKVSGESSIGIELIKAKTSFFQIGNQKFVNLNYNNPSAPAFASGFYEFETAPNQLSLFIKHHKSQQKITNSRGSFTNYEVSDDFILYYKYQYYKINSEDDFTKIFPDLKSKIDTFYDVNRRTKRTDPQQFMRDLLQFTGSLLSK